MPLSWCLIHVSPVKPVQMNRGILVNHFDFESHSDLKLHDLSYSGNANKDLKSIRKCRNQVLPTVSRVRRLPATNHPRGLDWRAQGCFSTAMS